MEVENDMIKSRRSKRGLSPIFATLILIAIAVIAGIVVYAFVSGAIPGLVSGPGAGSEKVAVQSANGFTNGTVTVDRRRTTYNKLSLAQKFSRCSHRHI
jgi:flagellin-like protein